MRMMLLNMFKESVNKIFYYVFLRGGLTTSRFLFCAFFKENQTKKTV